MTSILPALTPYIGSMTDKVTATNTAKTSGSFNSLLASFTTTTTTTVKAQASSANVAFGSDELAKFVQQIMASMDDSLAKILSPADEYNKKVNATSSLDEASSIYGIEQSDSAASMFEFDYESFVNGSGPLPAYLKALDAKLNLSAEQSQKLRDIAWDNRFIDKNPESIKKLGDQLREAGIG